MLTETAFRRVDNDAVVAKALKYKTQGCRCSSGDSLATKRSSMYA
jgi:hypothetical protein